MPASPVRHLHTKVSASTSGTTVDLSQFSTIEELFVRNVDTTNYVIVDGRVNKASKTFSTNTLGFVDGGAGAADTITDTGSTFLSSLYLKAGDYVVITGCTDQAANNTTFGPLSAAVAGTITTPTAQVTAEAAEAGTPLVVAVSPFSEKLIAGQWQKYGYVRPDNDLLLTANTAACVCEIWAVGT